MPHDSSRSNDPERRPLPREVAKSSLTRPRQRLVELMQDTWFGWVEDLPVRDGDPVLDPLPRFFKELKFDGDDGPPPSLPSDDFVLKSQVVKFLAYLDRLRNGVICRLEVRYGLPFRVVKEEAA